MSPRALAFALLVVLGCDSFPDPDNAPDFDGDGGSLLASVDEVCRIMNECGLWFGQESCEQNLLTPNACASRNSYLGCMSECVPLDDCQLFTTCESECWMEECHVGGDAPF